MNSGEIIKGIIGLFLSAIVVVGLLIALLIKYGTKFVFCGGRNEAIIEEDNISNDKTES
jgi:hypothetical protein